MTSSTRGACVELARLARQVDSRRLEPDVLAKVRLLVLDSVGCAHGATTTPWGRAVSAGRLAGHLPFDGGSGASVIGSSGRWSPVAAVGVNAELANCLDYDDTLFGHPGAVVVPTALALGEATGSAGRDVVTAVAAGYEVAGRLCAASMPTVERRTRLWGTGCRFAPAAAVVASRLLELDERQTAHAIAIAACTGPVPSVAATVYGSHGPTTVKNGYGTAAVAGVSAAYQARHGMTGPVDVLDDASYADMVGSDRWDAKALLVDRSPYALDVAVKPYSCCRRIHSSIDAALAIQQAHDIRPDEIDGITATSPAWFGFPSFAERRPTTAAAAQFSAPYCLAAALCGYPPGPRWFAEAVMQDPLVTRVADHIEVEPVAPGDEPDAPYRSSVQVRARQQTWIMDVDHPSGDPERPLPRHEIHHKFRRLTGPVLGDQATDHLIETIGHLEQQPDLAEVTTALA